MILYSCQPRIVSMPSGANEENGRLRRAWNKARLADPATGEIPVGIHWKERAFAAQLPRVVSERDNNDNWQSRGPWNVGGRTRALAMDVNDENHLLAGGVSGGIWESTDGGQSWSRRTPLDAHPGVVSIVQDTRLGKTNTWYALSGEIFGTSASAPEAFYLGDGMFKSIDNGETWSPLTETDNGSPNLFSTEWQGGWRVATDPVAADAQDIVYAATYGNIFRSVNGGANWSVARGGVSPASYYTDIAITSTGVKYAYLSSDGGQRGLWRSTNGTTWTNILPASGFPATYDRGVIGINPNNENEVWLLMATPESGHYTQFIDSDDWTSLWKYEYISGDGSGAGGTWTNLSNNLPNTGTEFDRFVAQSGYNLTVKIQPGTNHVFIGGTNIYRSTDGFSTPNNTTQIGGYKIGTTLPFFELYDEHHPDQHDMLFLPSNPNVMISASDGGVRRTEDCTAPIVVWTQLNRGYLTTQCYSAIIEKSTPGDATIISGMQDNGNFLVNSIDETAPWVQTVNGDGAFGAIPDGKPFYILSIQQGRVAKCNINDQGQVTAFRRIDPVGAKKTDYQFINPLAIDPTDQNVLYLPAGRRLFRQNNLADITLTNEWDSIAQGWTQFPDTLSNAGSGGPHQISAIAVSESNPAHRVIIGTTRGKLFKIDNANTGTPVFTPLTLPLPQTDLNINCIAMDPDNADDIMVVYSNYGVYSLYRSVNGGQNWIKVAGNLEVGTNGGGSGPSIRWLSILKLPFGNRKYFCGTSVGLFSADTLLQHTNLSGSGTQWAMEAPDLIGMTVVDHIEVRHSDGLVVAATHGTGLYSANFTLTSSSQLIQAPKLKIEASPNPATNRVQLRWSATQGLPVRIRLLDAKGRTIASFQTLEQQIDIPIGNYSPGVYYFQVHGRSWTQSGTFIKS
jgi:photosystem II stability/assembly factor-like uncharacterized protein